MSEPQQPNYPHGPSPYGQNPSPQNPYGQNPSPQSPYGQSPYGQTPYGYGIPPQAAPAPGSQPLTPLAPNAADINSYAPPKAGFPLVLVIVAAVALVGVVLATLLLKAVPTAPKPTPTPTVAATTRGPGQPFSMPSNPDSTGRWQILDRSWDSEGVTVHVRIFADTGTISYGFLAFPPDANDVVQPSSGSRQPELSTGVLAAGRQAEGYVFLPMPRGTGTLLLTTALGRQVSALRIDG